MNYKKLYEEQYREKKLIIPERQFWGLRQILKRLDLNRYDLTERFIDSGERVLDIGCGNGFMLQRLEGKFNGLYGIDVVPFRLKEAEANIKECFPAKISKFKFIEWNIDESLPFPDNFFDTVICLATMEHIFNIFGLVKEMYRVLKPNGFIIIEVPNIAYLKHRLNLLIGRLPITGSPLNWQEIGWDGGHLHYFTQKSLSGLLESSGFRISKTSGSGFLGRLRNFWSSLLTGDLWIKAIKVSGWRG